MRSSLYSHFSETLSGIATIRAYGEEDRFYNENRDRVNIENRAYWLTQTNQVSLTLRNSHRIGADNELAVARYSYRHSWGAVDIGRRNAHRRHTLQHLACSDGRRSFIHLIRSTGGSDIFADWNAPSCHSFYSRRLVLWFDSLPRSRTT